MNQDNPSRIVAIVTVLAVGLLLTWLVLASTSHAQTEQTKQYTAQLPKHVDPDFVLQMDAITLKCQIILVGERIALRPGEVPPHPEKWLPLDGQAFDVDKFRKLSLIYTDGKLPMFNLPPAPAEPADTDAPPARYAQAKPDWHTVVWYIRAEE
jgi:hypothetical protein